MSLFCKDDATLIELVPLGVDFDSAFLWGGFLFYFIFLVPLIPP